MKYIAQAAGTCGELVQGYLDGKDFLINSPISFFAKAKVSIQEKKSNTNFLQKKQYLKVDRVLKKLLKFFNIEEKIFFHIEMDSNIPRGKGLASSTAELTSALLAASAALHRTISDDDITQLLLSVDGSSDGIYLSGVAHLNHLNGEIYQKYYYVPSLSFIIVDVGGEVKTQEFDRNFARAVSVENEVSMRKALSLIEKGFLHQNAKWIAQAATLSARVNQHVLYKGPLDTLIEGTREFGGLGVNCGHTGTVLGVMFDHTQTDAKQLLERVHELIHPLPIIGVYPLIGGSRMIEEELQMVHQIDKSHIHHEGCFRFPELRCIFA